MSVNLARRFLTCFRDVRDRTEECEYYGVLQPDEPHFSTTPRVYSVWSLPEPPAGALRFVLISDTHEMEENFSIPSGDVLMHCGDMLQTDCLTFSSQSMSSLKRFFKWFNGHPHPVKVCVAGNHDNYCEQLGPQRMRALASPALYLCDESCLVMPYGLHVYGSPRSLLNTRLSPNAAFQSREAWLPVPFLGSTVKRRVMEAAAPSASTPSRVQLPSQVNHDGNALWVELVASGFVESSQGRLEGGYSSQRDRGRVPASEAASSGCADSNPTTGGDVNVPVDILVTHQPPGKDPIDEFIRRVRPRLFHACGHVHQAHGCVDVSLGTPPNHMNTSAQATPDDTKALLGANSRKNDSESQPCGNPNSVVPSFNAAMLVGGFAAEHSQRAIVIDVPIPV